MTEELDQIQIKNLEVFGKHGVFQEENKLGQKFLINAAEIGRASCRERVSA